MNQPSLKSVQFQLINVESYEWQNVMPLRLGIRQETRLNTFRIQSLPSTIFISFSSDQLCFDGILETYSVSMRVWIRVFAWCLLALCVRSLSTEGKRRDIYNVHGLRDPF